MAGVKREPCAPVCTCPTYGACRVGKVSKGPRRSVAPAGLLTAGSRAAGGGPACGCWRTPCRCLGGMKLAAPERSAYQHGKGALAAGNDVLCAMMTVDEAKLACSCLPTAVGFTFSSTEAHPRGAVLCYFKSSSLANSDPLWQRYMKTSAAPPVPPKKRRPQKTEPLAPRKKPLSRAATPPADTLRSRPTKRRAFSSGSGVPELKEENTLLWFQYIAERQRVYNCWFRGAGHPWTKDTVLAHGRMCNNYRFLDRESTWAIANIVEPLRQRPADLIFNILIFRCYLNWHKSMELLGLQTVEGFDRATFEVKLRAVHAKLGKLSSAAYNVGSFHAFSAADEFAPHSGVKPTRAAAMFAQLAPLMPEVARSIMERRDSLHTFKTLIKLKGVGRFLGWQSCLDLGYWNPEVYNESFHVEVGPGAEEGLSWLFKDTGGLDPIACVKHLASVQTAWFDKAGISAETRQLLFASMPRPPTTAGVGPSTAEFAKDLDAVTGPLNLMAIEGALCEGNKYFRVHYNDGSGRFKQQYRASTGADAVYKADFNIMMSTLSSSWGSVVGQTPTPAGTVAIGFQMGKEASAQPCLASVRQLKTQPSPPLSAAACTTAVKKKPLALPVTERVGVGTEGPGRRYDATGKRVEDPDLLIGKMVECLDGRKQTGSVGRVLNVKHVFGMMITVELSDGKVVTKRLNKIKQIDAASSPLNTQLPAIHPNVSSTSLALQNLRADLDREYDAEYDHKCNESMNEEDSPAWNRYGTQLLQTSSGRAVTKPKWLQGDGEFVTGKQFKNTAKQGQQGQGLVDASTQPMNHNSMQLLQTSSGRAVTKPKWLQGNEEFVTTTDLDTGRGRGGGGASGAVGVGMSQAQGDFASAAFSSVHNDEADRDENSDSGTTAEGLCRACTFENLKSAHGSNPTVCSCCGADLASPKESGCGAVENSHPSLVQSGKPRRKKAGTEDPDEWWRGSLLAPTQFTQPTVVRRAGSNPLGLSEATPLGFDHTLHSDGCSLSERGSGAREEPPRGVKRKRQGYAKGAAYAASASSRESGGNSVLESWPEPEKTVCVSTLRKSGLARTSATAAAVVSKAGASTGSRPSNNRKQQQSAKRQTQKKIQTQRRSSSAPSPKMNPSRASAVLPPGYVMLAEDQFVVEAVLAKRKSRHANGQYEYLVKWEGYGQEDNSWEPRAHLLGNISLFHFEQKEREEEERAQALQKQKQKQMQMQAQQAQQARLAHKETVTDERPAELSSSTCSDTVSQPQTNRDLVVGASSPSTNLPQYSGHSVTKAASAIEPKTDVEANAAEAHDVAVASGISDLYKRNGMR